MRRKSKLLLAGSLSLALILGTLSTGENGNVAFAAKKLKLSAKKISITEGKTKKVSVKNAKKKRVKWSIRKKSTATIKRSSKYAVKITGKKKGNTTLVCKVKNGKRWKTLKCKVTVKKKSVTTAVPSSSDNQNGGAGGSTGQSSPSPTANEGDSSSDPSTSGSPAPSVTPSTTPTNRPASTPTATPSATPGEGSEFTPVTYKSAGFESGTDGFQGRGSATLTTVSEGHTGSALSVTGRTASWNGAALTVTDTIVKGASYTISAWVKQTTGESNSIKLSAEETTGTNTTWPSIAQVTCQSGTWTYIEGTYTVSNSFDSLLFYFEGPDGNYDFLVDDVTIIQTTEGAEVVDPQSLPSLKDTYEDIFEHMGNVLSYNTSWNNGYQMQQESTMAFVQKQFNSFTLENEMKPDQLLPSWSGTVTVSEAKELGYVIPDNYKESVVAKLNFDNLDKILEIANQYGIQMRAHVLMWHQQTATRFFKENYSDDNGVVSEEVMDARLEFYVKSVMKHIMEKEKSLTGRAGSIVYCWDVANEYIHRANDPASTSWMDVYGDMGLQPTYVKLAFEKAYDMLKEYGLQNDVTLFYNDYNEYDCADEIVQLVNYINKGEEAKICGGIGMQSHMTINYPSVEKYSTALDKFLATGLQVQVTELDIGIDSDKTEEDQAAHYKEIMSLLISKHQNRDTAINTKGITGVTIWGLYDSLSWRTNSPLLFGTGLDDPKPAFYSVIEAAKE